MENQQENLTYEKEVGKEAPLSIAFIHNFLDEYGLDPYEFRLYTHIIRRTGGKTNGVCFATIQTIAKICKMSPRKSQQSLKVLIQSNLISKDKKPGKADNYRIRPVNEWVSRSRLVEIQQKAKQSKKTNKSEKSDLKEFDNL